MDSFEDERQHVVDYLASEAPDETVEHLEKVAHERILGRDTEVWDVHTNMERWWVITPPMNLYSQAQIPSMSVALSFHAGLVARVEARHERTGPVQEAERFPEAWRLWEQAGEAHEEADEAHDFQAVGMRCRESLLAFVREASALVPEHVQNLPKAGDFNGWVERVGNAIAPGAGNERRRGYLKTTAKATWELVNWLTRVTDAGGFDSFFAHRATGQLLSAWSLSVLRHEMPDPPRCPACGSYRLQCGWTGAAEAQPRLVPPLHDPSEETGPCIRSDVPLRGPAPPKPSCER